MILPNLSRADYDAIDAVNWSTLKWMARSPLHYRYFKKNPPKDTPAKKMGRGRHCATLEPEKFESAFVVWNGERKGNKWKTFQLKNTGREILTKAEAKECFAFAKAVREHPVAARWLQGGSVEFSMTWTVKTSIGLEIKCKARPDLESTVGMLVDLKSTPDASVGAFGRTVVNYQHHGQGAFYVDGFKANTGRLLPLGFIAAEGTEPYAVAPYRTPDEILDLGRDHYTQLLERLALCIHENDWPGYGEEEQLLTLPSWAMPRHEDEDLEGLDLNFNAGE